MLYDAVCLFCTCTHADACWLGQKCSNVDHAHVCGPVSGEMLRMATRPALLCIEKPYLEGFVDSFVAW